MSQQNPGENGASPSFPRIAPPEGERLARGQKLPAFEEIETPDTPPAPEILAGDESALQSVVVSSDEAISADGYESFVTGDGSGASPVFETQSEEALAGERFRVGGPREDTPKDQELGLFEHLNELRVRLMWCFAIVGLGMVVTWNMGTTLQDWFAAPISEVLKGRGKLISRGPTDFFTIYLEFTLAAAVILTAPLLFFQVWRFIEPALTNSERRYTLVLVPFSSVLFFLGAGLGYFVSPFFFQFFLGFQPTSVAADWDYKDSLMLMAKMLLVFGIMFQVPIVVIFGVKIGIFTRDLLIQYWRHAVVAIFTLCAILTPTWDPITLALCAGPPCLLYALSIWFVKWL